MQPLDARAASAQVAPPMHEAGRVGSVFIHGLERTLGGCELLLHVRFREPLSAARVARSYARQLRARPTLRLHYLEDTERRRYAWAPLESGVFEELLAAELECLNPGEVSSADRSALPSESQRTLEPHARLPFRLQLCDERTLAVHISHVLANGVAAQFWIEDWLGFYLADDAGQPEFPETLGSAPRRFSRLRSALRGGFWSAAFVASYRWRAGRRPAEQTLDLSRSGAQHSGGLTSFSVSRAIVSREDTAKIVAASRARGWSVTGELLEAVARVSFSLRPAARRLTIVVPTDMGRQLPHLTRATPGNTTGNMLVQLFRDRAVEPQLRVALRAVRRGVSYWMTRGFDLFVRDEIAFHRRLGDGALRPMSERGPYESLSFVLSNVGRAAGFPRLDERAEWLTLATRATVPMLTVATVGGAMTLQLTTPDGVYDPQEMHAMLRALTTELGVAARVEFAPALVANAEG